MHLIAVRFKTIRLITAALTTSILLYALVSLFMTQQSEPQPLDTTLVGVLLFMGILTMGAGAVIAHGVYKPEFVASQLDQNREWSEATGSRLMGQVLHRTIIGFALMETCGLFGFMQFMLYGTEAMLSGGLMMAVALLGMLASFPNQGRFINACESAGLYPPKD